MDILKKYALQIGVIALIIVAGSAAFFYQGYTKAKKEVAEMKQNPQEIARVQTEDLVAEVSQLIVLPTDETPTVATVSNLDRLQGQEFFANAKIGFKVLIFTKAKKAILYDPESKKIVEVAPLNLGAAATTDVEASPDTP
ncbi:MAG: hypothetical protein WC787_02275 [Patescibacteria group bacterium]|jgi:hypothetical protein